MSELENCRVCGEPRPSDAPSGLCPACLLKAGLGAESSGQPAAAVDEKTAAYVPPVEQDGSLIAGRYKLLEKIGEGGMGEVWVADQLEPIKRRVALKLIKPGMDSRSVLGRFEAERQALAVMDHPHIARVLDAGTTADGRPYFVMELVKGTPITDFCDARRLTPKQRLELFIPVCQAIQHAHMKGIIHRDIKPSNVLVALHDETPVAKVIDFGVAKAVGQQLTEKTIYTGFGSLVGTPAYMAPEQATFNQLDVDTRADVYALGVLLYELLAGSPPIEKERLKQAALDEVLRIVRDEEPPRPSLRLSTSQVKASIAATRQSDPARLSALMKGEIDWIVMKALEKDRTRRYDTANGLAKDIQRYLAGELVEARPPSAGYRLRKFVRRNKTRVAATALVALALAAGIAGTTWQAAERRREREVVRLQSLHAAQSALDRAESALIANRLADVDAALTLVDLQMLANDTGDLAERSASIVRDRDMVRELEEIYEQYWTVCPHATQRDPQQASERYPAAFRRYGIAVDELPTGAAADRIRPARIAPALIDGLGTWYFLAPRFSGLETLLNQLDPDEFRMKVRAAVAAGNEGRLQELAAQPDALRQPPVFAAMLAGAVSDPRRILDATWNRHPDSFAVALALTFPSSAGNEEGKRMERIGWCRTAVALRPNNALAHFYLSLARNELNDQDGRIESLRRAIELAPRFATAHAELGHALFRSDRTDEAFTAFRRAIELDPVSISGHAGECMVYLLRQDWVLAAAAWRAAATLEYPKFEEGCTTSYASGSLAGATLVYARELARGLIRLERFNDLVGLCVGLRTTSDRPQTINFGHTFLVDDETNDHLLGIYSFLPACAAVQAAAGRGVDSPPPQDRRRVRGLALEWLAADLKASQESLSRDTDKLREPAHATMELWLAEPLLNDVRGDRIAELPLDEQNEWKQFWEEVARLRDQTAAPAAEP